MRCSADRNRCDARSTCRLCEYKFQGFTHVKSGFLALRLRLMELAVVSAMPKHQPDAIRHQLNVHRGYSYAVQWQLTSWNFVSLALVRAREGYSSSTFRVQTVGQSVRPSVRQSVSQSVPVYWIQTMDVPRGQILLHRPVLRGHPFERAFLSVRRQHCIQSMCVVVMMQCAPRAEACGLGVLLLICRRTSATGDVAAVPGHCTIEYKQYNWISQKLTTTCGGRG